MVLANKWIKVHTPVINRSFLRNHLEKKRENNKWLGRLVEYAMDEDRGNIFSEFPYELLIKKSKVSFSTLDSIQERKKKFGTSEKTSYLISMPYHNPSLTTIKRIVKQIEEESFGKNASESRLEVEKRVALLIGLNNFESYDSEVNQQFEENVNRLRRYSQEIEDRKPLSQYVSLTINPFFWKHSWETKPKFNRNRIHSIQACYRIAKSYFSHDNVLGEGKLLISKDFDSAGRPLGHVIPYQQIRDQVLHSSSMSDYWESTRSELNYVLSLDGDFSALRTTEEGFLSIYDKIICAAKKPPHVMSTGYVASDKEENDLINIGIELDRRIRVAVAKVFPRAVYMPEPNMAFLITRQRHLQCLSWIDKRIPTMHTESRRLIKNGIDKGIFDPSRMVFDSKGGVATEIDKDWRTNTVNSFKQVKKRQLTHTKFQKALRGLHQSYADSEIWANNLYVGLNITISKYKAEGVGPLKNIREIFDPITIKNRRYPLETEIKQNLETVLKNFDYYAKSLKYYWTGKYAKQSIVDYFIENTKINGKMKKEEWKNHLIAEMRVLKANKKILKENYLDDQLDLILEAAIKTGEAIKDFYSEILSREKPAQRLFLLSE